MRPAQLPAPELTETEILKKRIEELEQELEDARTGYEQEKLQRLAVLKETPEVRNLYRMLCLLFDGATISGIPGSTVTIPNQPQPTEAWQMWKQRLPGAADKVIDALLVSPMTATQLIAATRTSYSTVQRALSVLRANSLTENDGDRIKLRRL